MVVIYYLTLVLSLFSATCADNVFQKLGKKLHKQPPPPPPEPEDFHTKYGTAFLQFAFTAGLIATLHLFPGQVEVEKRLLEEEEKEAAAAAAKTKR